MTALEAPNSKESEMMVLGSMLTSTAALGVASEALEDVHFYSLEHKTIFRALKEAHRSDKAADVHLIGERLRDQKKLDVAGGVSYLISLAQFAGTSAFIEEYADILKEKAKRRKLLETAQSLERAALKGDLESDLLVKQYRESLDKIVEFDGDVLVPKTYTYKDLVTDLARTREGLKTGYPSLDEIIEIPQGAITLVAGRPSHGKTITQLNLLIQMIKLYPTMRFYFFSYEEPKSQILLKVLNILAKHLIGDEHHNLSNLEGYVRGKHTSRDQLNVAAEELQTLTESGRLVVCDHSYYVDDLVLVISRLKGQFEDKLGAVFIDYIQKVKIKYRYPTRQLELQKISSEILETAKNCNIPIILGAQLGRGTGKKEVMRLDNLREAGDIENDAKLVLGIWNQAKDEADVKEEALKSRKVDLEFMILKNRNGPSNQSINLEFDRPLSLLREKHRKI
jgi:replicative DNA helicase